MAFNSFLLIPEFNRYFVEAIQRMAHQEAWDVPIPCAVLGPRSSLHCIWFSF